VFLIFYRALYAGGALYIAFNEYQRDDDLFEAIVFALVIAAALELAYWVNEAGRDLLSRFGIWLKGQEMKARDDELYPNIPLIVLIAIGSLTAGLALFLYLADLGTCNPASKKWLFRGAMCRPLVRATFQIVTIGFFGLGSLTSFWAAYMARRR